MDLYPYQQIFFTTLEYGALTPVFEEADSQVSLEKLKGHHVLLLTGIASPRQMQEDLTPKVSKLSMLSFPDHHAFSQKDFEQISSEFACLPSPKCIITTEKDAARIIGQKGLSEEIKKNIYILPVRIKFMLNQEEKFNENIIGYVRKNSRNSILVKRKDDDKPKDGNHSGDRPRTISFRNN
jgi:tetraacyldisaccharide 4'-kinase